MVTVSPEEKLRSSIANLHLPDKNSHKGQNGKLLVIGGSSIFHAASIWAAEAASRVVDMVHYSSTKENGEIMLKLKSKFVNGIVIKQEDLLSYVEEDDCILIGPGMERGNIPEEFRKGDLSFDEICKLKNEAEYTYALIRFLMFNFPHKKFVFDAAALQMMDPKWLLKLSQKPILTPHCKEFTTLFGKDICDLPLEDKILEVQNIAQQYNCVILFKQITDIVTDGTDPITVTGGNAGLTKGGTGDVLAGIAGALYTRNEPQLSAILASYLLKKTAEDLFVRTGVFFNTTDVILQLPLTSKVVLY